MNLIPRSDPPHLEHTRPIPTHDPPSKRRIDARQRSNDILMRLEQILLVMRDHRHPLRRPVVLIRRARRLYPRLDVARHRAVRRSYRATYTESVRDLQTYATGDTHL